MWGYDQDPSGFKRWAIGRPGAFRMLLDEVETSTEPDEAFYGALGELLPAAAPPVPVRSPAAVWPGSAHWQRLGR